MKKEEQKQMAGRHMHADGSYTKLFVMAILSFVAMYTLMYAMADSMENVLPNINEFYMAGLMTMPMIIIELALMGKMYVKRRMNAIIIAISSLALVAFFLLIRFQTGVSDRQFLKGMIPHHAAAILMSEQSKTKDPEIRKLQQEIISSQRKEIIVMKAKLDALKK